MILKVSVKPNAKKTMILQKKNSALVISVAAPPDKNKANKELVRFLSKEFRGKARIKSGLKRAIKIVQIEDCTTQ